MKDQFDCAIRTMFLRRKLRAIEARRIKYPATNDGRRRFIQDSLKPGRYVKFCYCLAILLGIAGMTLSLIWSIEGIDFFGSWLAALLSMALIALGSCGLSELKKRQS
jgi:hypothetical protein